MNKKLLLSSVVVGATLLLGLWGYSVVYPSTPNQTELERWLDIFYSTLRLFAMEGDPKDSDSPLWQLSLARVLAAITVFGAAIGAALYLLQDRFRQWVAQNRYSNHTIICGLGDRGRILALDLLKESKQVVVIDKNPNAPHAQPLKEQGAVFIAEDAALSTTLKKAGIAKAAHLVTLTDNDAVNLEIFAAALAEPALNNLHCRIHLTRMENRALFAEGGCYAVEKFKGKKLFVTVFNLYENAAIKLFESRVLGSNADTLSPDAPAVKLLIAGFGKMGEAVLLEAMTLGHFYNQKPISITVMDENAAKAKERFLTRYHQVPAHTNGKGLNLWNLEFIDSIEAAGVLNQYRHIIAAHDDDNEALAVILNLHERYRIDPDTSPAPYFSFHAPKGVKLRQEDLEPFGATEELCSREVMLDDASEKAAHHTHHVYSLAKLKDNRKEGATYATLEEHDLAVQDPNKWLLRECQPLFKRRSNLTEKRHIAIKLMVFGLKPEELDFKVGTAGPLQDLELPHLDKLPEFKASASYLMKQAEEKGLDKVTFIQRCDRLAEVEHARWNAFQVLDNWRYGPKKIERLKTHDCLLDWKELHEKRADTVKYDYKNIYQIPEVLALMKQA